MIPGFTNVGMFPLLWEAKVKHALPGHPPTHNLMSIIDHSVST